MKNWTPQQLQRFAVADDLRISPFYSDGKTYGTPTWIWSVVVADHLYVRAWHGTRSSWYRSAVQQRAGRIYLDGQNFSVAFAPATDQTTQVDAAYRQKYGQSAYLLPMIQAGPQAATVEIFPR